MKTSTKTMRLPESLVTAAESWGEDLGLTFTDVVEHALRRLLGVEEDPAFELVVAVRDRLAARYPDGRGFPQDVTLEVFREIRDDAELRTLYDRAVATGEDRDTTLASLHRRLGRTVKQVLGATVVGRSLPLDPNEVLIQSHALLAPSR